MTLEFAENLLYSSVMARVNIIIPALIIAIIATIVLTVLSKKKEQLKKGKKIAGIVSIVLAVLLVLSYVISGVATNKIDELDDSDYLENVIEMSDEIDKQS